MKENNIKLTTKDWITSTLGEFVTKRSKGIVPNKTPNETFELYSVPSLVTEAPEIIKGKAIGSNKQIVSEGTVLLCKINPRINRTWVISPHSKFKQIASTEWITFPSSEAFIPKYLAYYLKQDEVRDFLAANASGVGGSLMRVKPATIKDYPFPIAPLEQQKCIVVEIEKQFSRLDEAIANLKRVKANLKRYKAAVLKAAVEGKLVGCNDDAGSINHWTTIPISDVLESLNQGWSPRCEREPSEALDVWGVIKTSAVQSMCFVEQANKRLPVKLEPRPNLELAAGDLLITRAGPRKRVGVACLVKKTRPRLILCDKVYRLRCNTDLMIPAFLELVLNAPNIVDTLNGLKTGISDSGVNLTQKRFKKLVISLPPLSVQKRIVDEIQSRLSINEELKKQIEANIKRANRLRQSTLKQAFSGQLFPSNPADEPASVLLDRI